MSYLQLTSALALLAALAGTVFGGPSTRPFPARFDLAKLFPANGGIGADGLVFSGLGTLDQSGWSVSSAGDVNDDGISDVIIGAPGADVNGRNSAGRCYVIFGSAGVSAGSVMTPAVLNGTNGFAINGIDAVDYSGRSVSSAGDVNGDGIDDLIIGAPLADPNARSKAGESYVVYGSATLGSSGQLDLSTLNGATGFVLAGLDAEDQSGVSVSSAGDVNGDGIDDLIIGAPYADPNGSSGAGECSIIFGRNAATSGSFPAIVDLSEISESGGVVLNGVAEDDHCGFFVSAAGDVNGDGIDDFIVGAPGADPNGITGAGECYVVFGAVGLGAVSAINLSALNGTNGFVLRGVDSNDQCGYRVASAGDVNDDGFDDLIIGAPNSDPSGLDGVGGTYVVFGAADVGAGGGVDLATLNGINGFVARGIDGGHRCGSSVAGVGDINGDGIDDLVMGAPRASPRSRSIAGESYLVFGAADLGATGTINLASLDGANGVVLEGVHPYDESGSAIAAAGDVNGDGVSDVIIGARLANYSNNAGASYIVFGRTPCLGNANSDKTVDFNDISTILAHWLAVYSPETGPGDADGNGIVNIYDINTVLGYWLNDCP